MSSHELSYRSTTCNCKIDASKFVAIFIFIIFLLQIIAFSLEFVSLRKKNNSLLLLLIDKCKIYCLIN